jgi:prepilin-type N-terminal cleavage/methylation domain-containing protein
MSLRPNPSRPSRPSRRQRPGGFTLIEVIAGLVLLGILAGMSTLALAPAVKSYQLREELNRQNQRAQIALTRLIKEITWADPTRLTADVGDLRWFSLDPDRDPAVEYRVTLVDNELRLGEAPTPTHLLLRPVEAFVAAVVDPASGTVELRVTTFWGEIVTRVLPRPPTVEIVET